MRQQAITWTNIDPLCVAILRQPILLLVPLYIEIILLFSVFEVVKINTNPHVNRDLTKLLL